jgi:hypothetical protein
MENGWRSEERVGSDSHMVSNLYAIHEPSPTYFEWEALMVATVQIEDGQGGYIVINQADFDDSTMRLFVEGAKPAPKKRKAAKKEAE